MAQGQLNPALRHLRRMTGLIAAERLTDAELLERYASRHDEGAFAAIVLVSAPELAQPFTLR